MKGDQPIGAHWLHVRIAANQAAGCPYFHEDPARPCSDPGACHRRGFCRTAWHGRNPASEDGGRIG